MGHGILSGKKTYVTGFVAIVTTVGAYLTGEMALADAAQLILTAILGMTIRHGVSTETK